jgi:hypothetical protein
MVALFLVAIALAGHVMLSVVLAGRRCVAGTSRRDDTPETVCECFVWDGGTR